MDRVTKKPAPKPSAFAVAVEDFKARFPDEWEACRLWPTESGLLHMISKFKD